MRGGTLSPPQRKRPPWQSSGNLKMEESDSFDEEAFLQEILAMHREALDRASRKNVSLNVSPIHRNYKRWKANCDRERREIAIKRRHGDARDAAIDVMRREARRVANMERYR